MCHMDNDLLSSSLKAVSFNFNDSWTAKSWNSSYPFQQQRARFQQKQLQEKEEKLLKLYEEQQERALKSVGSSHSQSGGSSTSSVGVGKVRHMFQSRRGNSESKAGVAITGRDKSYPLEPLTKYPSARNLDRNRLAHITASAAWGSTSRQRSVSLDRNNRDFPKNDNHRDLDSDENYNYARGDRSNTVRVQRTQSQARSQKPKLNSSHYDDSRKDLHDLGHEQSFQLVNEHYNPGYQKFGNVYDHVDDCFVASFNTRRLFYENRLKSEANNNYVSSKAFSKLPSDYSESMDGRYKSYVSQSTFTRKPHLGNGTLTTRTTRVTEVKETTSPSGYLNGSVSSPVRKIRKPTPVPLSVAPPQHLLQKEVRRTTTRTETIREVPPSISSTRTPAIRTQSTHTSIQKPPTSGRSVPSSRISPAKSISSPSSTRSAPSSNLVNCRICGRNFAADRISKHEEVCQKSSKKRKPFDALQQRVKGTEVEQYVKKSAKGVRGHPDLQKAPKPQSNWRKKHEEFINNIRAAKEVSAHLKKGGKLSDLPPPPPSDYSDYIQCPHCSRKFNSSAAERHIPKCANIINNKPKPNLQKNVGLKQGSKLFHAASPSVRGRK